MEITLQVPDSRAGFLLELLHSLPYVELRSPAAPAAAELDETAHLLSSPANAERLYAALARAYSHERSAH
jgi:hypothetical protein